MSVIQIYTDGGSRGNPGPAAWGYVIEHDANILARKSQYIGSTTNNVAEYMGLVHAMEHMVAMHDNLDSLDKVQVYADSELMIRQLNGVYKVKKQHIKPLYERIMKAVSALGIPVVFTHVRREYNKEADALVNEALDNISL